MIKASEPEAVATGSAILAELYQQGLGVKKIVAGGGDVSRTCEPEPRDDLVCCSFVTFSLGFIVNFQRLLTFFHMVRLKH